MHAVNLILSDARGIYIPRDFLTDNDNAIAWEHCKAWGLTESNFEHWKDALDPEHDWYWYAWEWILSNAKYKHGDDTYFLWQDGDLWGLCFDKMTDEEKSNFGFED